MIYAALREYARQAPERLFALDAGGAVTAREAYENAATIASALSRLGARRLYFYAHDSVRLILALIAAQAAGSDVCVVNRNFTVEEVKAIVQRLGHGIVISDAPLDITDVVELAGVTSSAGAHSGDEEPHPSGTGGIIILTTGTTGFPKAAFHDWARLLSARSASSGDQHRWLLAYPLNHFAGIQVFLHVLQNHESLYIAPSRDYGVIIDFMIEQRVDAVSATPTFWRMMLGRLRADQHDALRLRQITIGGEASTPELLERLISTFPAASLTQVYATTELGTCFAVKDRLPGFPASFLDRPVGNVQLRISDSELFVRSSKQMVAYVDGSAPPEQKGDWVATGDLVEHVGTRVLFRGRKTEVINVGGVKVHPLKVEEVVLRVPGVAAARVYGRANPVTGQIVACEVELADDAVEDEVRRAVQQACRRDLNRYEQPRQISVVSRIDRQNEKLVRRA
jgi:acyl-coenzyme A synthetase/AMP-(fatty) acid ligase